MPCLMQLMGLAWQHPASLRLRTRAVWTVRLWPFGTYRPYLHLHMLKTKVESHQT
jgi:hypothetical protein